MWEGEEWMEHRHNTCSPVVIVHRIIRPEGRKDTGPCTCDDDCPNISTPERATPCDFVSTCLYASVRLKRQTSSTQTSSTHPRSATHKSQNVEAVNLREGWGSRVSASSRSRPYQVAVRSGWMARVCETPCRTEGCVCASPTSTAGLISIPTSLAMKEDDHSRR